MTVHLVQRYAKDSIVRGAIRTENVLAPRPRFLNSRRPQHLYAVNGGCKLRNQRNNKAQAHILYRSMTTEYRLYHISNGRRS